MLAAALFGGTACLSVDVPDGVLGCADPDMYPGRACPEGFYCGGDNKCYRGQQPTSCSAVMQCEFICLPNGCNDNCLAAATDQARTLWNAAFQCALGYCVSASNGVPQQCAGPNDTSSACRFCFKSVLQTSLGAGGHYYCASQAGACQDDR